jgi:hypothetical protein
VLNARTGDGIPSIFLMLWKGEGSECGKR